MTRKRHNFIIDAENFFCETMIRRFADRPVPIKSTLLRLSRLSLYNLEHTAQNVYYRLYWIHLFLSFIIHSLDRSVALHHSFWTWLLIHHSQFGSLDKLFLNVTIIEFQSSKVDEKRWPGEVKQVRLLFGIFTKGSSCFVYQWKLHPFL